MFSNRTDAGVRLADRLGHLRGGDTVVVGLPRGGVPVAYQVARTLDAPLDVILVRKLGVPHQPELAMGAIGEDGVRVIADDIVRMARVTDAELARVESRERIELDRRASLYRAGRKRIPLRGRVVIVVDDGVATGSTAKAACQVARQEGASRVILGVPVAPVDWTRRLVGVADELIALDTPEYFFGIGQFYRDFSATSDEEVIACLDLASKETTASAAHDPGALGVDPPVRDEDVAVRAGDVALGGHLRIPERARGVVIFAHGSGSSRHSPRNRYVASALNEAGLATLLVDLLSEAEEAERANVFDIELLTRRLVDITRWVRDEPDLAGLEIGYFGASTGAAAALSAAAESPTNVSAVVSRGGRPDLAGPRLGQVRAPTLLIVGGHDNVVLGLNREAQARMKCPTTLEVIPRATHLFEEPGTLRVAAEKAASWFLEHLVNGSPTASSS
ncbi:MAG: phosphoribosyltransferase [Acidimicrobiia bacterium]|nr:phosphoribosyltransferase [Acidimicrobiia bacterium]